MIEDEKNLTLFENLICMFFSLIYFFILIHYKKMNTIGANTIFGSKVYAPFWVSFRAGLPSLLFIFFACILMVYALPILKFILKKFKK